MLHLRECLIYLDDIIIFSKPLMSTFCIWKIFSDSCSNIRALNVSSSTDMSNIYAILLETGVCRLIPKIITILKDWPSLLILRNFAFFKDFLDINDILCAIIPA